MTVEVAPDITARSTPTRVTSVRGMHSEPTTAELLRGALAGDRDAWARIVEEYSRLLWWVARSHRLDDATAADVVQTVWLQLVRFGDRITEPDRLGAWLATTARRESMRRITPTELPGGVLDDTVDALGVPADERLLDEETLGVVLAAFERLSPDDQHLLRLVSDVPPRSYEEIGAILGRPPGSIGPTRQRAIGRLRSLLHEMGLT